MPYRIVLPELFGGSADLAPSTNTWMSNSEAFSSAELNTTDDKYEVRNVHFGVREHAMGSIVNGIVYHGGLIPFGATFMVFSDYMRPTIRIISAFSPWVNLDFYSRQHRSWRRRTDPPAG